MAHTKALVVGFEGVPGCGKTTIIRLLILALRALGIDAIAVDADTSRHAPALRAMAEALPLDNLVRSAIFWHMRKQQHGIIEAMRCHTHVVFADRTLFGTAYAYDVYGNGVERELLDIFGQDLRPPDITFLLEIPLAAAQKRKASRTMRDPGLARRVQYGYAELAGVHGWIRVDATRTPEQVKGACLAIIRTALAERD